MKKLQKKTIIVETCMTETRDSEEKSMIEDSEELEFETVVNNKLRYGINDRPNVGLCLLLALQHFLERFTTTLQLVFELPTIEVKLGL